MDRYDVSYNDDKERDDKEKDGKQALHNLDWRIKALKRRLSDLKMENAFSEGYFDDSRNEPPAASEWRVHASVRTSVVLHGDDSIEFRGY
jgi:hypothetical protein